MFGPGQGPYCHRIPTEITYNSEAECKAKAQNDGGPILMKAGMESIAAGITPVQSGIACKPAEGTSAKQ